MWIISDLNFIVSNEWLFSKKKKEDERRLSVQVCTAQSDSLSLAFYKVNQTHSTNKISTLQGRRGWLIGNNYLHILHCLYIASSTAFSKITLCSPYSALPFWTINLLASDFVLHVVLFRFVIRVLFVIRLTEGQCNERITARLSPHCTTSLCTMNLSHKHSMLVYFLFLLTSLKLFQVAFLLWMSDVRSQNFFFFWWRGLRWDPGNNLHKTPTSQKTDKSQNIHFSETDKSMDSSGNHNN